MQLAELRRRASAVHVDMTVTVQHGKPADVILCHATSSSAVSPELIVLGAPSRHGRERFSSPSVAQAVVHQIDRPTLIVPGGSLAKQARARPSHSCESTKPGTLPSSSRDESLIQTAIG